MAKAAYLTSDAGKNTKKRSFVFLTRKISSQNTKCPCSVFLKGMVYGNKA